VQRIEKTSANGQRRENEKKRKNIYTSIFDNQILKFKANTKPIDEEILGKTIYQTFDFTVICLINYCLLIFIII